MPICINCSHPLPHLYTTYSKADDRSLGKGVRLTQCSNCKRFADKYVEHDYVVLFIDLVLIKPQVYRHLLFNRLNTGASNDSNSKSAASTRSTHRYDRLDPSIARLGILLVLFDVYITWARIEKGSNTTNSASPDLNTGLGSDGGVLTNWPILGQYLFFLTMNLLSTIAQHGTTRILARIFFSGPRMEEYRSGETGGGMGHSRNSSAATERPTKDRGRDRDTGVSSTVTSPTATPVKRNAQIPSPSPHRYGHNHGNDSYRSTPVRNDSLRTPHRQQHQHENSSHSIHVDQTMMLASPHRSPPSGSAISTALLVSSCTKLFPILLVIWPTTGELTENGSEGNSIGAFGSRATSYIGWVVLFNNIEALMILLQPESGYLGVTALAVAGFVVRFLVESCFLSAVSLATDSSGPVSDFLSLLVWMKGRISL